MTKTSISQVFGILAVVAVGYLGSSGDAHAATSKTMLRVTALVRGDTGTFVYFDQNHMCNASSAFFPAAKSNYNTLMSMFLSAQATRSHVAVNLVDSATPCAGSNSTILSVCVGDDNGPCF